MGLTKNLGWLSKYITADSSGKIGIGANPSGYGAGKLVVSSDGTGNTGMSLDNVSAGDFTTSLFLYGNGDLKCRFDYDKFASRGIIGTVANIPQTFWTNNTERIRIFPNGNTYIGPSASDTGARLQLEGSNDILSLRSTDAATRSTMALVTNGYDWEVGARGSANNPANAFYIYNNDTSSYRFIIAQSGNVLVGKQSDDGQKLQVSGGVTIDSGGARGLRIDTNNGVQGLSLSPNSIFGIDEPGIGNGRFVINNSGQVGIGTNSPVGKVHSMGPMVISNYAGTFRRTMTVHGATGAFSQVKVILNKTNWGSVTYDIKLASAGGSYHTAGAYYSNPGFSSHLTSINSGWGISMSLTAASPNGGTQGATWTFSGATMIHPSLTVDISCGYGYQIDPNDIIVEYT